MKQLRWTNSVANLVLALLLASGFTTATRVDAARPHIEVAECAPGVDFLGFSDALNKQVFEGTNVGGLSGLVYDRQRDVYYSLVDNERSSEARFYTLHVPVTPVGLGTPVVLDVTTLRDSSGQPFTGDNVDLEGIVLTRQGELLIASENEPLIRRFSLEGTLLGELQVPERFRLAPLGEGQDNLTFESLSISPNGRSLFTATEGALLPDGTTADGGSRTRILRYEDRGPGGFEPAEQFPYLTDPGLFIAEVVALSEHELLVLERGFVLGMGNTIRVYSVSLAGATDVSDVASLATAGIAPVEKELVFDLASCPPSGATNSAPQPNPLLDNFEGLALGPHLPGGRRALLLQSDNNFRGTQITRLIVVGVRLHGQGSVGDTP